MAEKSNWQKHMDFFLLDVIIIQLGMCLTFFSRFGFLNPYEWALYRHMAIVLFMMQCFALFFTQNYQGIVRRGYYKEFIATVKYTVTLMAGFMVYAFVLQNTDLYSRYVVVFMWLLDTLLVYAGRILWKRFVISFSRKKKGNSSLFLVASAANFKDVFTYLQKHNYGKYEIKGALIPDSKDCMEFERECGIKIFHDREESLSYISREWVDEVFISLTDIPELQNLLVNDCMQMGITAHIKLEDNYVKVRKQEIDRICGYMVLSNSISSATPGQLVIKRMIDIVGGLIGMLITGVLYLFIAPKIKKESPGPVFFSQERIGKNGRRFKIYKFRSMYLDAEERKNELRNKNEHASDMMFKMDDDPRIIGGKNGIGGFIRRTSIDELPQMWNVVKGEMSLVGTRPPTVDEWERYSLHHRARLAIKPGITGLWQVSGRSNITDFEEVVRLDTKYITEWNLGLDIKILLKTFGIVFAGDGAK